MSYSDFPIFGKSFLSQCPFVFHTTFKIKGGNIIKHYIQLLIEQIAPALINSLLNEVVVITKIIQCAIQMVQFHFVYS